MASASMASTLLRSLRAAQQCAHRPCQIRQYSQLLSRTAETTRHSLRPLSRQARPDRSNAFSTSTVRPAKTIEQLKARSSTGPFSWKSAVLFVLTGAGMIVYFQYEKARLERERIVEMSKGVGKPRVGGPFVLKDLNGETFTEENLKGKYSFVRKNCYLQFTLGTQVKHMGLTKQVYFGFTHCPDICPDELDKMAEIIDEVRARSNGQEVMRPVFITCDPARDSPEVLRGYLNEFHKDIIGLTGTYEQVKDVCRQYRVYFSTPQNIKPGEDYLVDHSIYFYLMG